MWVIRLVLQAVFIAIITNHLVRFDPFILDLFQADVVRE